MVRIFLLIILAECIFMVSPARPDEKKTITYFSANILYCDLVNGEKRESYVQRRELLIELLAELKPDVIGIQEASVCRIYGHPSGDDTVEQIVRGLKERGLEYGAYFWQSESIGSVWLEGLAFLWNSKTVDLSRDRIKCRYLKDTYVHRGAQIRKSLCRAEVSPKNGESVEPQFRLLIYNTHLDARNNDIKQKQAGEIRSYLKKEVIDKNRPALFGGDLNHKQMKEPFEETGFRLSALSRVDYIFSFGIPEDGIESRIIPLHSVQGVPDISDHHGIFSEISVLNPD